MKKIVINNFFHSIADVGMELWKRHARSHEDIDNVTIVELCHSLLSNQGEASGIAIARRVLDIYETLSEGEKLDFYYALLNDFHVDADSILYCATSYQKKRDFDSLVYLTNAVEPLRQELFRRINMAPEGTSALVKLRSELLSAIKTYPDLKPIDVDLSHLFASWFNRGFLQLERIDWNTPASILEKVMEYESVHAMQGWNDLRKRLAPDRRCFAFFHGALPDDPLVFVEVALVNGLASSIQLIIDDNRNDIKPEDADTAIFYSINNCHDGLRGVSFGNFLIKQVVIELRKELPTLKTFSTLSPIPGLCKWLNTEIRNNDSVVLKADEREKLKDVKWDVALRADSIDLSLEDIMMHVTSHYLFMEKQRGFPLDPVARFHLRNGARLERINWMGDLSLKGVKQSAGMLVNYLYDLNDIEENHENYVQNQNVVASDFVKSLIRINGS